MNNFNQGCLEHESGKNFADSSRYIDIMKDRQELQLNQFKIDSDNGLDQIMKESLAYYPIKEIEDSKKNLALKFWIGTPLQLSD